MTVHFVGASPGADHPGPGVALIGAGPGDPDLITVRGRNLLRAADVVLVDRLAPLELLAGLRPGAEIIDAAKLPCSRTMAQEHINEFMMEHALTGQVYRSGLRPEAVQAFSQEARGGRPRPRAIRS